MTHRHCEGVSPKQSKECNWIASPQAARNGGVIE